MLCCSTLEYIFHIRWHKIFTFLCYCLLEEINLITTNMSFVKVVNLLLSILTATYTIYVVGRLTLFLSAPRSISKAHTWIFNLLDNKSRLETAYGPIVWDVLYVIGFIYQHSVVKSAFVKSLLRTLGLATAERTIYVLTSSLCLHVCIWRLIALRWCVFMFTHNIYLVSTTKLVARSIDCAMANWCGGQLCAVVDIRDNPCTQLDNHLWRQHYNGSARTAGCQASLQ